MIIRRDYPSVLGKLEHAYFKTETKGLSASYIWVRMLFCWTVPVRRFPKIDQQCTVTTISFTRSGFGLLVVAKHPQESRLGQVKLRPWDKSKMSTALVAIGSMLCYTRF